MVNPGELVQAIVDNWRDIPELVAEVAGDPARIFPYWDRYALHPSILDAIYQVPQPGVMVCWTGSTAAQDRGGFTLREHHFAAYIRVKESSNDDLGKEIYRVLVLLETGIPSSTGDNLPFLNIEVDERVEPIGPMSQRRIITPPPQSLDYFEATFSLREKGPGEF
jgi:hypothetical protein